MADLVIRNARCVATMDGERRELAGGWVAITDGWSSAVGASTDPPPGAAEVIDATDCLVTPGPGQHPPPPVPEPHPGLPADDRQAAVRLAAVAVPAVARRSTRRRCTRRRGSVWPSWRSSGCTTSTDHLYLHPRGAGDLLRAEIAAARELGHALPPDPRLDVAVSEKDGGLPPDDVVADDDEILAASEAAVARHHDRAHGAMVRIALAPCSPFTRHRAS